MVVQPPPQMLKVGLPCCKHTEYISKTKNRNFNISRKANREAKEYTVRKGDKIVIIKPYLVWSRHI